MTFETKVSEGAAVQIDEREGGLALSSTMKEGVPLEEQVELTKRTQVTIGLPDLGLEPGQAVALNVVRQDADGEALGGIGLMVTGLPGSSSPRTRASA